MKNENPQAAPTRPHSLTLEGRSRLQISGVEDVDSFNEQMILLLTSAGAMTLMGSGLHIANLNLEEGRLLIEGQIDALEYDERARSGKGGSLFSRLMR